MNARVLLVCSMVLALVLALCGGADAANIDWRGAFGFAWNSSGNWCPSGVPTSVDHVFIEYDTTSCGSAASTCELNISGTTSVAALDLEGADPTKMTLKLKDGALDVNGLANFEDYAELLADHNFTADDSDMIGDIWMNVANTIIVDLGLTLDVLGADGGMSGITCTLHLEDNTSGKLTCDDVLIAGPAAPVSGQVGLKLDGMSSTFEVTSTLSLISTVNGYRAKLWVAAGTVKIDNGTTGNAVLYIDGGDTPGKGAILDIDDVLTSEETMFAGDDVSGGGDELNYTGMDVASGKTAKGGKLTFEPGVVFVKQGAGTFQSGN